MITKLLACDNSSFHEQENNKGKKSSLVDERSFDTPPILKFKLIWFGYTFSSHSLSRTKLCMLF